MSVIYTSDRRRSNRSYQECCSRL